MLKKMLIYVIGSFYLVIHTMQKENNKPTIQLTSLPDHIQVVLTKNKEIENSEDQYFRVHHIEVGNFFWSTDTKTIASYHSLNMVKYGLGYCEALEKEITQLSKNHIKFESAFLNNHSSFKSNLKFIISQLDKNQNIDALMKKYFFVLKLSYGTSLDNYLVKKRNKIKPTIYHTLDLMNQYAKVTAAIFSREWALAHHVYALQKLEAMKTKLDIELEQKQK